MNCRRSSGSTLRHYSDGIILKRSGARELAIHYETLESSVVDAAAVQDAIDEWKVGDNGIPLDQAFDLVRNPMGTPFRSKDEDHAASP